MRHRYDPNAELMTDENGNQYTANDIYMSGPTSSTSPSRPCRCGADVLRVMARSGRFGLHHLSPGKPVHLDYLRKLIGIPAEKFHNDLETTGNTSSATIPSRWRMAGQAHVKAGPQGSAGRVRGGFSWAALL
jgi:hypothetical protein